MLFKIMFDFTGVKAALLVCKYILVILRDNKPDIPYKHMERCGGGEKVKKQHL